MPIIEGPNSEGVTHCRDERLVEGSSVWSTIAPCTDRLLRLNGVGQLVPPVTIRTLPDDALLKIFKSFVDSTKLHGSASDEWHTLVHVCRRWRYLAFTSPRHLNLQLLCKLPGRSVKQMLDIWPDLPIYIHAIGDLTTKKERDDYAAALALNHRISGIHFDKSDSAWEAFTPLMERPFPALTYFWIRPPVPTKNPIPRFFLSGSAPGLQDLILSDIPFPTLPELLLSTANLVRLQYNGIPRSGYISPQAMVAGLSALTRLQSLSLTFESPKDFPDMSIRIPSPHTRTLLPALTHLCLFGVPDYVEGLVAQINAPSLRSVIILLFHQEVSDVSELATFVRHADKLSFIDRAEVTFARGFICIILSQEVLVGKVDPKTLVFKFPHIKWRTWPPYLAELWASCFLTPSPFEYLRMDSPDSSRDIIDDPDPQWLELLRPFSAVKDLRLSRSAASRVAQALGRMPPERVMEVLPALEIVFVSGLNPFGPVKEAICEFADARQLSGHPVSIHWEGEFTIGSKEMDRCGL